MNYDVDYFLKKFESIPDELWCVGNFVSHGKCCALGHCGERDRFDPPLEARELSRTLSSKCFTSVSDVNDGHDPRYQQPTPKARVLAALRDIKVANCSQ